ncbi:MAG: FliA/WhiG family RNA polymerase sigma factor [Actinobacteria bacterium]|nr:FliA/WhiG family RNA polymerase sigma factor [Actinomycetota bacterium]
MTAHLAVHVGLEVTGTMSDTTTEQLADPVTHYAPIFDDDRELATTWVAAKLDQDAMAVQSLVVTYTPLVRYVVSRMNVSLPPSLERADLVGFGTIGLIDAIHRFDMDRGLTFQTYAVTRIRGTILDELRSLDWVPRAIRGRMHSIDRATAAFEQDHGCEPGLDEIVAETGLGRDDVRSTLAAYRNGYLASLDERMSGDSGGDDDHQRQEFVDQTEELPEEIYDHEESQRWMRERIRGLPQRDRAIIALYYFEELTFAEIGRVLHVSESRVCQVHGRAIKSLRDAA